MIKPGPRIKPSQVFRIDYRQRTSLPIRDMERDGRIVFWVDIYGLTGSDVCIVPGGGAPAFKAVERLGLDPYRYQASIFDADVSPKRAPLVRWGQGGRNGRR